MITERQSFVAVDDKTVRHIHIESSTLMLTRLQFMEN